MGIRCARPVGGQGGCCDGLGKAASCEVTERSGPTPRPPGGHPVGAAPKFRKALSIRHCAVEVNSVPARRDDGR